MFWEELYIRFPNQPSNMFQLLYKYLLMNRQIGIPGIGLFQLDHLPARFDIHTHIMHPPLPTIRFTQKTTGADKSFFQFVSREMQVQEWESIRRFHDFTYKLKNDLNTRQTADLPGMGVLTKNKLGEISFEPTIVLSAYFPAIAIQNTYLNESPKEDIIGGESVTTTLVEDEIYEETLPVEKDRWWIGAIVLAVVAIALIVYYYVTGRASV